MTLGKKPSDSVLERDRYRGIWRWNQIMAGLSELERQELLNIAKVYGEAAMGRVLEARLSDKRRLSSNWERLRAGLQMLGGLSLGRKRSATRKVSQKQAGRDEFVTGFVKMAEPLMRSMMTLAFTARVLERYLSKKERDELERDLAGKDGWGSERLSKVTALLEERSGVSMAELTREQQVQVEEEFFRMWVANWEELLALATNPHRAKKLEKAMGDRNLSKFAGILMRTGGTSG